MFYINTPLIPDQLQSVAFIVKSNLDLPLSAMSIDVMISEASPYMTYLPAEGIGNMTRSTRSNLLRTKHGLK